MGCTKDVLGQGSCREKEDALRTALERGRSERVMWTDRSRLEDRSVGAAVAWWVDGGWRGRGTYLGTNKEVFDTEGFAILQAIRLLSELGERGQAYTIFSDSQAAVSRVQHSDCGPAQALARAAIDFSYKLRQRNSITVWWTLAHAGVEGNEQADAVAKRAAAREEGRADPEYLREASLSHLTRKTTKARSSDTGD